MTVTGDSPQHTEPAAGDPHDLVPSRTRAVYQVCPYLQGEGGGWRSLQPTRDHRCAATQPAAEPAVTKQRDLCLRAAHETCATYVAARALEHGEEPDPRMDAGLWPTTKQSVLALRPERAAAGPISARAGRTGGQALLAALIIGAFAVLAIARTSPTGGDPGSSLAAAAASPPAVVQVEPSAVAPAPSAIEPSPVPSGDASAMPAPTPSPATPSMTPGPGASGSPAAPLASYTVKGGDTLSSIAVAHGVTVRQLRKANGIEGTMIRPGQELVIP